MEICIKPLRANTVEDKPHIDGFVSLEESHLGNMSADS